MNIHGYETDAINVEPINNGNALYITFKKTGLTVYMDDTTDENIIHLWNEKDAKALPPSEIYFTSGEERTFTPHVWKEDN